MPTKIDKLNSLVNLNKILCFHFLLNPPITREVKKNKKKEKKKTKKCKKEKPSIHVLFEYGYEKTMI